MKIQQYVISKQRYGVSGVIKSDGGDRWVLTNCLSKGL